MTDQQEPVFQPLDQLPRLTMHMTGGITMAEMNLSLFRQASTNERRLTDEDVATLSREWAANRDELVEQYVEQGRRWQALELSEDDRSDVDHFVALAAKALELSETILTVLDDLKGETVEATLAKGGDHLGLDKLRTEQ